MYNSQKHKEYYAKVKEQKIKNTIAYTKKRLQEDPEYKLRHTLGIKLSSFIRSIKGADMFLGCDILQFIKHVESQFTSEMNWSNHGTVWEIDHKKPISLFKLSNLEEQKLCFHYTNLQPLLKNSNRSKLNKYEK
jgi:5-methylcytosine-specific restriction endonuclease McrA